MADDLKTFREVTQSVDNLKGTISDRFGTTHRILYYFGGAIITVLIGICSGAIATYKEIGSMQTDVAVVKSEIKGVGEKLAVLSEISTAQNKMQVSLARVEERLPGTLRPAPDVNPFVPLALDKSDNELIRSFLSPKGPTGAPPSVKVGDVVPAFLSLNPVPNELVAKIPKLAGTRFALDDKGGFVLIASAADNRVLAIV